MPSQSQEAKDASGDPLSNVTSAAASDCLPASSDATDGGDAHSTAGPLPDAHGSVHATNGTQDDQPTSCPAGVHHVEHGSGEVGIEEGHQTPSEAGTTDRSDEEAYQAGQEATSIREEDANESDEREVMKPKIRQRVAPTPANTWWSSEEEWQRRSRSCGDDDEDEDEVTALHDRAVSPPATYYTSNYYREPKELSSVYGRGSAFSEPSKQRKSAHLDDAHLETEPQEQALVVECMPSAGEIVARRGRRQTAAPKTVLRTYSGSEDDPIVTLAWEPAYDAEDAEESMMSTLPNP
ncbi:hypothetical protein DOTSEDRAFT_55412 [Dothistroma septosporum NZE10]|uniref:Uncharacterized protein n=1 Tax=Dothistroma septosporum (strain NZE10 / CBS 128990) TaxID=675120 RepID=N1PGA4_DOTSN|nr:hypothetical protein DOTSEDRAFT_55412 [Dothistroma septosporum NZE10]